MIDEVRMPAYNFQKRFVPMILSLEKSHTIRRRRRYPTKVGDRLYLYTGMRTKQAVKFAEATCSRVQPLVIYLYRHDIWIDDQNDGRCRWMSVDELDNLAMRDGFESRKDFFWFFLQTYKRRVLTGFEIIWWDGLVEVLDE
jgi:hypothetical protein